MRPALLGLGCKGTDPFAQCIAGADAAHPWIPAQGDNSLCSLPSVPKGWRSMHGE